MKSTSWIIMLAVLFSIGFIACNNSRIKNYAEANPKAAVALTPLPGNEIFTCTMHNEVMSAHPGECSKMWNDTGEATIYCGAGENDKRRNFYKG